jgi:hypothetical protein
MRFLLGPGPVQSVFVVGCPCLVRVRGNWASSGRCFFLLPLTSSDNVRGEMLSRSAVARGASECCDEPHVPVA